MPALRSAIERALSGNQERIPLDRREVAQFLPNRKQPRSLSRKPLFGSGNLVLRKFGRRIGRRRIPRLSGSLRGVGVRVGNRILRRFFDGFVERRLFRPRFLDIASRHVTPSWPCLHGQGDGPHLVILWMNDKRILLGDAGECFEVNRPVDESHCVLRTRGRCGSAFRPKRLKLSGT